MKMKVNLKNERTGQVRQRKLGFSWTTFFFGFFPALFRGDWKWALIIFAVGLVTLGLSTLVFMFIYNKLHIRDLLENGYEPADEFSANALRSKGFKWYAEIPAVA
jgi:hypothetical protein